jgi:hypothetical protein
VIEASSDRPALRRVVAAAIARTNEADPAEALPASAGAVIYAAAVLALD